MSTDAKAVTSFADSRSYIPHKHEERTADPARFVKVLVDWIDQLHN